MLMLLQRLPQLPAGFSPAPWIGHPDPRVRYEALLLQLTVPSEQELALHAALEDSDVRTIRTGLLAAVQLDCPRSAIPAVARIAVNPKMTEETRVLAIRALGRCTDAGARDTLLQIVDGGRTLLGRPKLAAPTPLCIAALKGLAEKWTSHPPAAAMLAIAAASPDPEVRQAVRPDHMR
jgi:HEAT repeat protein